MRPLIEETDYWVIPIRGEIVTQCRIDYAFGLEIWESDDFLVSIRIGGNFLFKTDGEEHWLSTQNQPTTLCLALSVLHKKIDTAVAYKNGRLELKFEGNLEVSVPPDLKYEAWELSGTGGLHLVCRPGGGLAIWQPE